MEDSTMKVNIYVTEDVSDEERKLISQLLGVRQATRDQLKEFMWTNGSQWRDKLGVTAPDEDLI
jgi:hypothetical protein